MKPVRHPFWQAVAILVVAYILIAFGIPHPAAARRDGERARAGLASCSSTWPPCSSGS